MVKGAPCKKKKKKPQEYDVKGITGHGIGKFGKKMTLWFEVDWVKYPNPEFQPVSSLGHCLDSVLAYLNNEEEKYIPPDDIPDMSIRSPVKTIRVYDDRSKPPDVINFGVPKPFNEIVSISYGDPTAKRAPKKKFHIESVILPHTANGKIKVKYRVNDCKRTRVEPLDKLPLCPENKYKIVNYFMKKYIEENTYKVDKTLEGEED